MKRFVDTKSGWQPVNPSCTCYDLLGSKCVGQQVCDSCKAFPNSPNCNYRVGNRLVPRYQTPVSGNIYATSTNRFRNAAELMPLGTPSGGFGLPIGNSGRDSYQNANGSAEEIGGRQGNPTRGLYAVEIVSATQIKSDKLLYNVLVNAMKNQGLPLPMGFSPKLVNKGYSRGYYSYLFEIRDGFRASNFVEESRLVIPANLIDRYTATFISGYLHTPKFARHYQNAVGMGNSTMVAPAFGGTQTPSSGINNYCIKCYKKGCGCVKDERGRPRCDCGELTPSGKRLDNFCRKHPELCSGHI